MQEISYPNPEPIYFVAYNNDELFCHYGKVYMINVVTTGLDNIEQFGETDAASWVARVADFGITLILENGVWLDEDLLS